MIVTVRFEKAYGNLRYYAENEIAEKLLEMLGRKSFTKEQMKLMKSAGFEINIITEQSEEEYAII